MLISIILILERMQFLYVPLYLNCCAGACDGEPDDVGALEAGRHSVQLTAEYKFTSVETLYT